MASSPENNASLSGQKVTCSESSQAKTSQHAEEAIFYMNCRAAYLTILKSSLENIKSKEQLSLDATELLSAGIDLVISQLAKNQAASLVLQQAGRNPSQKTVNKYWTSQTTALNFDDFCTILKEETPATKTELLEAFGKIDTDNTGYILHDELYKILTTQLLLEDGSWQKDIFNTFTYFAKALSVQRWSNRRGSTCLSLASASANPSVLYRVPLHPFGVMNFFQKGEKMTLDEVSAITKLADFNCSGKLDYKKFCDLYMTTSEQCCKTALEKLEVDSRLRRQQFGSQGETSTEGITRPVLKPSPKISRKTDHKLAPAKGDSRTPSRPSSAQTCTSSVSSTISMGASSNRNTKLIEPNTIKEWQCAQSKGCFYLEEDGEIISHKYRLHLPQRSTVCITIKPLSLRQVEGKSCHWLSVDTALYVLKENETQENLQLVSFTEQQNKEMFGWNGELASGVYWLLPFTTGCRLKKAKTQITGEAKLVYRGEDSELALTKECRAALLDIFETIDLDGNGLLSLEEYNFFELRTSGEKCDEEAWAVCKENFDMKKNELTRQGFVDLNLMEANDREGDPSDLWVTLLSLGYNKALEMTEACPFVIDIYAEKCKPRIKAIYLEAGSWQLNRAICKSVVNKGDAKVMDGCENIIVYTYRTGMRITSVIENKSENKVIIHVNNERSKNCLSNRGLTVFAVEVAPKSMMVSQHVMPLNEQEEWLYNCVHSLLH